MSNVICKCGSIIPDEYINYGNRCNEEGEDYSDIKAYCSSCNTDFETDKWGECDNIEEAKEVIQSYIEDIK